MLKNLRSQVRFVSTVSLTLVSLTLGIRNPMNLKVSLVPRLRALTTERTLALTCSRHAPSATTISASNSTTKTSSPILLWLHDLPQWLPM